MTQDDPDDEGRSSGAFRSDGDVKLDEIPLTYRYSEGDVVTGKYRLGRLLGQGGMGDVWLAHNQTLDIDIAIKLLRAEAEGSEGGDRLLREARAAARLGHPAIVRVFDFGTTEFGEPFIVMELLEGEDLATSLARHGRLSGTKAVRTILPIAHALAVAHAKRIVHRDLKPENIFLTKTEDDRLQPKIVDFGIATIDRGKNLRITQKGTVMGSPGYMSPEQARGDEVDHRADIWSLCVVLYETLTGTQPFVGKNDNALLYAIIAHEPAPITALAAGDATLSAILEKGLAKDPDKRWQSMHELGVALAEWLLAQGCTEDIAGASLDATWLASANRDDLGPIPSEPVRPLAQGDLGPRPRVPTTVRPAAIVKARKQTALLVLGLLVLSGGALLAVARNRFVAAEKVAPPPPSATVPSRVPDEAPGDTAVREPAEAPPTATAIASTPVEAPPFSTPGARKPAVKALASRPAPHKSKPSGDRPRATLKDPFQ